MPLGSKYLICKYEFTLTLSAPYIRNLSLVVKVQAQGEAPIHQPCDLSPCDPGQCRYVPSILISSLTEREEGQRHLLHSVL